MPSIQQCIELVNRTLDSTSNATTLYLADNCVARSLAAHASSHETLEQQSPCFRASMKRQGELPILCDD